MWARPSKGAARLCRLNRSSGQRLRPVRERRHRAYLVTPSASSSFATPCPPPSTPPSCSPSCHPAPCRSASPSRGVCERSWQPPSRPWASRLISSWQAPSRPGDRRRMVGPCFTEVFLQRLVVVDAGERGGEAELAGIVMLTGPSCCPDRRCGGSSDHRWKRKLRERRNKYPSPAETDLPPSGR